MAKYKNFPDPVIQHIYSLADRVNEDAMELEEMKLIDPKSFGKVATSITNAFLKETTFQNPFQGTEAEETFHILSKLIESYILGDTTGSPFVQLSLMIGLVESGNEPYLYLTDALADSIVTGITRDQGIDIDDYAESDAEESSKDLHAKISDIGWLMDNDQYEEALDILNTDFFLSIDEHNKGTFSLYDVCPLLNNRAFCLFQIGRYEDALKYADELVKDYPNYDLGWYTRAEILEALGRFKDGVESMDKAIQLDRSQDKIAYRKSLLEKIK